MPRSVGCLGFVLRGCAVGFFLVGVAVAGVVVVAGGMLGGGVGLLVGLAIGAMLLAVVGLSALSLWARTRIMENWSGGVVGVYPAAPPRPSYYDNELRW
jgi:hypothetical protein